MTWLNKLRDYFKRQPPSGVKSFRENQTAEEAFDPVDRGGRTVALDKIIGSVGRYHDFDARFRLKDHMPTERFQRIRQAMLEGRPLPPVRLYQIKDEYYVLDGNHRIAAAKALGREEISATILEFIPSKNTLENIIYREKTAFGEQTGLDAEIVLTEVGQYDRLLEQITVHQGYLTQTTGIDTTLQAAAQDWYKTIYGPLMAIVDKSSLLRFFPERTRDDMYVYISYHQWEKRRRRQYGIGIDKMIPRDMEEFRDKMAAIQDSEYPEMKRTITAFVLMNVNARSERRIMEKVFALEEVCEVHVVHGSVDIVAKIELTRDLLSSDAEIIGDFVHQKIRQINGVSSTQTLIPGHSKSKD
jgi:hypothetical protein